jgi:NitT/TauT family transport system permease protein
MKARLLLPLLFIALCLLGWEALRLYSDLPAYIFPGPAAVARRIVELFQTGFLFPAITATLGRMLTGYLIVIVGGIALGLLMGGSRKLELALRSTLLGLQTLPSAAWTPLALLVYGLSDSAILFVIVLSALPATALASCDAVRNIPPQIIKAALTLGTPAFKMPFKVVLPAALPGILTAMKIGWTLGWHGAVSAELIRSTVGLGFLLHMGRELSDAAQVIGIMVLTVALGYLIDSLVFGAAERRVRRRYGLG